MRLIITIALILISTETSAIPWPILNSPKIANCSGSCSSSIWYSSDGANMVDINPVGSPFGGDLKTRVEVIGVHCKLGNAMTGDLPFRQCSWAPASGHAPKTIGKCELRSLASWELTSDSTCSVAPTWGPHTGAGPGGECVMFSNSTWTQAALGAANTPWGLITADQAANSGNRFCSKPLQPTVRCELNLPSIIDHGMVVMGATSKREDDGNIDCGYAPKVDVLVNGDRDSGGVRITASLAVVNRTTVRIVSEIRVSGSAVAGEHNATYVFVASPY